MSRAYIFDIARCSLNDGPGLRTTIFFQGCNLKCFWCHNPESKGIVNRGDKYSVKQLVELVLKDKEYYDQSGGGVTISGGEPMLQFDFLLLFLKELKRYGIETALETSGAAPLDNFKRIIDYIDLFLFDYKTADVKIGREVIGVDLKEIECNFHYLYNTGAEIIRRCPIIPTINDNKTHIESICKMSLEFPRLNAIDLLPYHNIWQGKKSIESSLKLENLSDKKGEDKIRSLFKDLKRDNIYLNSILV
jgi:pyruvate formate lyase activating enzyme